VTDYKRNPYDGSLEPCTVPVDDPGSLLGKPINPNTVEAIQTTVTTTPTVITLPEGAETISIRHLEAGVIVWIGEDENIAVGSSNVFPLLEGDVYGVTLRKGDSNNLYAVVASGSVTVYTIGATIA